jgi:hypothetical protein
MGLNQLGSRRLSPPERATIRDVVRAVATDDLALLFSGFESASGSAMAVGVPHVERSRWPVEASCFGRLLYAAVRRPPPR